MQLNEPSDGPIRCHRVATILSALLLVLLPVALHAQDEREQDLPIARVGEPYRFVPSVDGLTSPVRMQWRGKLPKGLTLVEGGIEGTPSEAAAAGAALELTVTDALAVALRKGFRLRVRPAIQPLSLVTRRLPTFIVGEAVDMDVAIRGGEGALVWRIEAQQLPAGLSLDTGRNGEQCRIQGTPNAVGPIEITISVTDEAGSRVGPVDLSGRVGPAIAKPIEIVRSPPRPARVGVDYHHTFQARGGVPPYRWILRSNSALDTQWLAFDPEQGSVSGKPGALAEYAFSLGVTDASGAKASWQDPTIKVEAPLGPPLELSSTNLPTAVAGQPYHTEIVAMNPRGKVVWQVQNLPGWLQARATGPLLSFSGNPGEPGTSQIQVSAEDRIPTHHAGGTNASVLSSIPKQSLGIRVIAPKPPIAPPRITTDALPDAMAGLDYDVQIAATGGEGPVLFDFKNLPAWVRSEPSGRLRGQPTESMDAAFEVSARDSRQTSSPPVQLRIRVISVARPQIQTPDQVEAVGIAGHALSVSVPVTGGLEPYSGEIIGSFPEGISFDSSRLTLVGKPEQAGTSRFSIQIRSSDPKQAPRSVGVQLRILRDPQWVWRWAAAVAGAGMLLGAGIAFRGSRRRPAR
jgi:hypothetical protein